MVVAGVEAVMASVGALTTPGTKLPLAILDMGGGSTDAAVLSEQTELYRTTHQAGAGELVSMLIETELGLKRPSHMQSRLKSIPWQSGKSVPSPAGKWTDAFVEESIDPRFYGQVVLLTAEECFELEEDIPMEQILEVRREAKTKSVCEKCISGS